MGILRGELRVGAREELLAVSLSVLVLDTKEMS